MLVSEKFVKDEEDEKEQRGDVQEGEGEALRNEDRRASRRSAGNVIERPS
jgi:hypothetical protein